MFSTGRGDVSWFEERGCQWKKVCAEPGDLIVWDSRTPHYNISSSSTSSSSMPTFAAYVCCIPVCAVSQENLKSKREAFEQRKGTTHWPDARVVRRNETRIKSLDDRLGIKSGEGGVLDPVNRMRSVREPVLGERAFRLTGIPYIKQ
jgi:hypothetical protein